MPGPDHQRPNRLALIYVLAGILAACSIVYELVIAHTLSLQASNTVVWYSVIVGIFLGAMGLGSFLSGPVGRRASAWRALLWVELALALTGALVVPVMRAGHMLFGYMYLHGYLGAGTALFFAIAFGCAFFIGILTGIELPMLIRLGNEAQRETRQTSGVLGADYLGSLLGGLAFPLLLVPRMEPLSIGLATAGVNLAASLVILLAWSGTRRRPALDWAALSALAAALLASIPLVDDAQAYFLKKFYYYAPASVSLTSLFSPMEDYPEILRVSSPYQKIDLVKEMNPGPGNTLIRAYSSKPDRFVEETNRLLFLNHDYQVSLVSEELYHEYFAHVPIMSMGRVPLRVLVMGAGDGLLIRELLKYEGIGKIVHVELDPEIHRLASTNPILSKHNRGSLIDPRVENRFGDAYYFARNAQEMFDCAYIDFPMAADYNLSKLYSREFYQFLSRLIHDDGFIAMDAPGIALLSVPDAAGNQAMVQGNDWPVYYNTLRAAGFAQIIPYLTTLEVDPQLVADELSDEGIPLSLEGPMGDLMAAVQTVEERDTLLQVAFRRTLQGHVESHQQGFIMMARKAGALLPAWRNFGVDLYILNEERFTLAFAYQFPVAEEIDPELVNSIMRPVFPTLPIWDARVPY